MNGGLFFIAMSCWLVVAVWVRGDLYIIYGDNCIMVAMLGYVEKITCDICDITDLATSVTSCFLMTSQKNPTDKDTTKDMRSVSMMTMDDCC